jgi:hypothetical protein
LMLAESWYNNKTILRVSRDYNIIIIPWFRKHQWIIIC